MAPNQKPSLAARIFQGGGSAGLLGNPMFNIGMGLLAKGQDNRIPYATAVMSGLQNAQVARQGSQDREAAQAAAQRTAQIEALQMQELLQRKQRDELARTQYRDAIDQMYPASRPPMMNAGQPNKTAGLLKALGPDRVPPATLSGLLDPTGVGSDKTTNQRDYEFYSSLDPEGKAAYGRMRRGNQTMNIAGVEMPINPATGQPMPPGDVTIEEWFDKTLELKSKEAMQNNRMAVVLEDMKVQGAALRDLPIQKIDVAEAVRIIDQLRVHPGLKDAVGNYFVESYANTEGANFIAKLDGLRGRNFLQAIEKLKGSGTITEVEGAKAEAALQSLATRTTEEGFREALDELERALKIGLDKLRIKAGEDAMYIDPDTMELLEDNDDFDI